MKTTQILTLLATLIVAAAAAANAWAAGEPKNQSPFNRPTGKLQKLVDTTLSATAVRDRIAPRRSPERSPPIGSSATPPPTHTESVFRPLRKHAERRRTRLHSTARHPSTGPRPDRLRA